MTRALIVVGAVLVLCIGGLVAAAVFLSPEKQTIAVDNLLAEDFSRAVARGGELRMERLADDFDWDRLLIVERGTGRDAVSAVVGTEFTGEVNFQTGDLIVFLDGKRVARFADYRGEGSFEGFKRPIAEVLRSEAVFDVRGLVIRPG